MSTLYKTYPLKLVLHEEQERLEYFKQLVEEAMKQLMKKLWSEEWITKLGTTKAQAHSIVKSTNVELVINGEVMYLPSRVRMGIAERVGRILRSQYKRMNCFYDCLKVIQFASLNINERTLMKVMQQIYRNKNGFPKYRRVMVVQTISMIKNLHERLSIDFSMFNYTNFVEPRIKNFFFPFAPDDNRILNFERQGQVITFQINLPTTLESKNKKDWEKVIGEIAIPEKIQEKINESINSQPSRPKLIMRTLKGGKNYFFLTFPWEFSKGERPKVTRTVRALAIDLGVKKLATAVVCQNKKQLSRPIYIKQTGKQYQHIERLYNHIAGIQIQLEKEPTNAKLQTERTRVYNKINRIREEIAHQTANCIMQVALDWKCKKIIFEDLRHFKPQRNRKWSRKLSEWLRGKIPELVKQRSSENGLTTHRVNPWGTSIHCPRCTTRGEKVYGPNNLEPTKKGRWFYCPECNFSAERDYVAAINIYRASFIDYKEIRSLAQTNPVPYTDMGIPSPNCSWRRSRDELTITQVVVVTGG
ncbi:MAG: zinc ribbon domain-containing protein [Candidatus Heimdallarchaeota archaeon]